MAIRASKKKNVSKKALDAVKGELSKDATIFASALRTIGEEADARIKRLSPREFNARYVLRAKRELGLMTPGRRKGLTRRKLLPSEWKRARKGGMNQRADSGGFREVVTARYRALIDRLDEKFNDALKSDSISRVENIMGGLESRLFGSLKNRGRPSGSSKKKPVRPRAKKARAKRKDPAKKK